jgi:hypothetical protein
MSMRLRLSEYETEDEKQLNVAALGILKPRPT